MLASVAAVVLVVIYAVGSGVWVSANPGWYASLEKPSWQPPDIVFGLIWPYNFIALAVVLPYLAVVVANAGRENDEPGDVGVEEHGFRALPAPGIAITATDDRATPR